MTKKYHKFIAKKQVFKSENKKTEIKKLKFDFSISLLKTMKKRG